MAKQSDRGVERKRGKKKTGRRKKMKRSVWQRVPGDVLCRVLEQVPVRTIYQSQLVCKHWKSCWEQHNWAPVWEKEGAWVLSGVYSGTFNRLEVWCPKTGARFPFSSPGNYCMYGFETSSQGLVLNQSPNHDVLFISNPLFPHESKKKLVPPEFQFQQPQLLVEDAAKGVYKVALATRNSTHVYDSVTGGWETFETPEEFLSHGDPPKGCVLASRATRLDHPFTSPGSYMAQLRLDNRASCNSPDAGQPAWKCTSALLQGYPDDAPAPFSFRLFHDPDSTGGCIGVLLKRHYPADQPFIEVVVYELAEEEESLKWKRLGRTELLKDIDWSRKLDFFQVKTVSCLYSEKLLVFQVNRPFFFKLDKYSIRECNGMQPVVFNVENRTWTYYDQIQDEFTRSVRLIFKPNLIARP